MTAYRKTNSDTMQTIPELAAEWKLHEKTLRRLIQCGKLPAVRLGRQLRIRQSDKEKFLRDSEV